MPDRVEAHPSLAPGVRVALIASSYAPHVGGVEEHVRQAADQLRSAGVDVEVWAVDRGTRPETQDARVRYLPTPLPSRSTAGLVRFSTAVPRAWRQWSRAFREFRPDLLHVQCFGPNGVYAVALRRRRRVPLIVTSHGETRADDGNAFERSGLLRSALRRAIGEASAVTAPSQFVLDDLRGDYGLVGGEVVPNGVDLDLHAQPAASSTPYVFAAGRLGRMKGFDLLIDAFVRARLDPAVRLVIGGDGDERGRLERLIADHDLADRVELRGWMAPQEIADAMGAAMFVVVPSRMEAFGIVALEAWRSGAALLMTDRGGGGELVEDGVTGMLVDPTDVDALATAIRTLAGDPALRERLAAAGHDCVERFTWAAVADAYHGIYARTLSSEEAS